MSKKQKEKKIESKEARTEVTEESENKKKVIVSTILQEEAAITENSNEARELYNQSRFGDLKEDGKVHLSLIEAFYLLEKGRIKILDGKNKEIPSSVFLKKAKKINPGFIVKYAVFKDMRNRGYIVKTALKFGADFRVYDRGVKPGEDHAKWVLFAVHESSYLTWHEFSAKNRVAHSTRKKLLIGCVDEEGDVTYWEIGWRRP